MDVRFYQRRDVAGVSRGAGRKTDTNDPTSDPVTSFLGNALVRVHYARPRRSSKSTLSLAASRGRSFRKSPTNTHEHAFSERQREACESVRHRCIRKTKTKTGIGDILVTDCLSSDVQLQRKSFVVTDMRSPVHPCTLRKAFGPSVGLPP